MDRASKKTQSSFSIHSFPSGALQKKMVARHLSVSATSWSGDESLFGVDVLAARARARAPTAVWTPGWVTPTRCSAHPGGWFVSLLCTSTSSEVPDSANRHRETGTWGRLPIHPRFCQLSTDGATARHPGMNGCGTAARAVVVLGDYGDGPHDLSNQTPTPTPLPCHTKNFMAEAEGRKDGPSWTRVSAAVRHPP